MNELEFWAAIFNSWPLAFIITIVIVSLIYGKQIRGVLNRLSAARFKIGGLEADISSQIDDIQAVLPKVLTSPETPQLPDTTERPQATDSEHTHPQTKPKDTKSTNIIDRFGLARDLAQSDTRSAILTAWNIVEQRLGEAVTTINPIRTNSTWMIKIGTLQRQGYINDDLAHAIKRMRSVRNQAAHPRILETDQGTIVDPTNPSYDDAMSYIDLAQTITATLDLRKFLDTLEP